MKNLGKTRLVLVVFSVIGLLVVYLFQRVNLAPLVGVESKTGAFLLNRSVRFILNDVFAITLIYALFGKRKFVVFALWVQLFGLLFILVPYFILRIYYHSETRQMISFLHRLALNPTLLLLLIPAFYYQTRAERKRTHFEK